MLTHLSQQGADHAFLSAGSAGERILRPLLAAAATTDPEDADRWALILQDAHEATEQLANTRDLPSHLTVARTDPPVLATRTIAAAWRHVTHAPSRRAARVE